MLQADSVVFSRSTPK